MANVLTFLNRRLNMPTTVTKRFKCVLSGSYVNGGAIGVAGEVLSFNTALNPQIASRTKIPAGPPAARLPANTDIEVANVPNGYLAQVEQNAVLPTPNNFILRIFAAGSGNAAPVELSAGAYPAALTSAPLVIEVNMPAKFN